MPGPCQTAGEPTDVGGVTGAPTARPQSATADIVAVQGMAANKARGFPVEETISIVLRSADGVLGTFLLSVITTERHRLGKVHPAAGTLHHCCCSHHAAGHRHEPSVNYIGDEQLVGGEVVLLRAVVPHVRVAVLVVGLVLGAGPAAYALLCSGSVPFSVAVGQRKISDDVTDKVPVPLGDGVR
jgi:hypothetical protein